MNLMEVLVAAVIFAGASCASAQVLGMGAAWSLAGEQRQEREERLEAAVATAEAAVRGQAAALAPRPGACEIAAGELAGALGAAPVPAGVSREVTLIDGGRQVVLRLEAGAEATPRQRLFRPAALALCGGAAAGANPTAKGANGTGK